MKRTIAAFAITFAFAVPALADEECHRPRDDKTVSVTPPVATGTTPSPVAEAPILLPVVTPATDADG